MFAYNAHADSRGTTSVGVPIAQSWSGSVFPLSLEFPLDWRGFLGFDVTAAFCPVRFRAIFCCHSIWNGLPLCSLDNGCCCCGSFYLERTAAP